MSTECSCLAGLRLRSIRPRHAEPHPAALAASHLPSKVQAVLHHRADHVPGFGQPPPH